MKATIVRLIVAAMMWALGLTAQHEARADLIASFAAGTNTITGSSFLGQAFTTGAGTVEKDISFNFFGGGSARTPFAIGTGYLLSQQYVGSPDGLSSVTAGYLGSATASGGFYNFGSSVELAGNTTYYFYEDAAIPGSSVTGSGAAGSGLYYTATGNSNFGSYHGSTDFAVIGTPATTVPEPASLALVAVGMVAVGVGRSVRRCPN